MFLEVMDGDLSFIPIEWVKAVFRHLQALTHAQASVCSVVGTQSTGKSTMLNVMLNL
jgi:polynucleotide 5'-kinase involved in rRNA processing